MNKRTLKNWLLLLPTLVVMSGYTAQAGVASEALEFLFKRVARAGAAATRSLVSEAAEKSPVVARLVRQYGEESLVTLARTPGRVRLVEQLGDDAAEALLKHADIAEDALRRCPDAEVASALSSMSRESGQCISICASKNSLSTQDYKTVILVVREGGEEAAEKLSRMSPSALENVLKTAQTAGLGVAVTMVVGTATVSDSPAEFVENMCSLGGWIYENPIPSLIVFLIVVSVVIKFPDIVVKVLLYLPRLFWGFLRWVGTFLISGKEK